MNQTINNHYYQKPDPAVVEAAIKTERQACYDIAHEVLVKYGGEAESPLITRILMLIKERDSK